VSEPQPPPQVYVALPPELAAGVYAGFAQVWWDSDIFTIDFASLVQPAVYVTDEATGGQVLQEQGQVVARVRIPPAQVWELARVLTQQLDAWEQATGRTAGSGGPAVRGEDPLS
jgi:hypothetical protein